MNGICVTTLSLLAFFALISLSIVSADCPDFTFRCPTGESFTLGTCWSWWNGRCEICHSITSEVRRHCRQYSCKGSVEKWYERNDGCSAGFVGRPMTHIFGAACAIHDICYATPGRTKSQCDGDFHYNMQQTCKFPSLGSIWIGYCAATAGIAYLVVKDHGRNFPDFAETCHEV